MRFCVCSWPSAARLNGAGDPVGELRVGQELLDQCVEDLLSGDAGNPEAVGGLLLPQVEGAVGGQGEVDGSPGALLPGPPFRCLPEVVEALGRPGIRPSGWRMGAKTSGAGFVGDDTHFGDPLWGADQ